MKRFLTLFLVLLASPALAKSTVLSLTVDHGTTLSLQGSASSVFIANPDIADVQVMSPNQVMIFGKRTGETTFLATDNKGQTLAERTVVVVQDLSELRDELNAAIPGNTIQAKPVPNGIVLTGEVKDPVAAADAYKISMRYLPAGGDIINRIQVSGSNQIQIRVRFAEVQRNVDNSLGFNWQNLASLGGGFTVGLANGVAGVGSGYGILGNRPSNTTLNLPNDVIGASVTANHLNIDGVIDALAQDGLITILAEPNLTAMSGETANFLAGGEFPIPIPQGNGTISISFKDYGVSLAFTPTLLSGNRISLHVRPEVSELTNTGSIILDNITVPALTTRKAETTVEVASGESFAIAGLMDNSQTQTVNKFPFLGDMPILGALFRSSQFQNGQTELVVIITPYIVKPSAQKLAIPTDGLAPPSEKERLLGLRYSASDPTARPISGEPSTMIVAPPETVMNATVLNTGPALQPDAALPTEQGTSLMSGATSLAPPPQSAPAAAVTTAPVVTAAPASAPVAVPPPLSPAAPMVAVDPSTMSAPLVPSRPPLVLHSTSDTDKHSGGLLVE